MANIMNSIMEYSKQRYLYFLLSCSFLSLNLFSANQNNGNLQAKEIALAAGVGALVGIIVVNGMRNKIEFDLKKQNIDLLKLDLAVAQKQYDKAALEQPAKQAAYEAERIKLEAELFKIHNQAIADKQKTLQNHIEQYTHACNECERQYGVNAEQCEQNRILVTVAQKALIKILEKQ